MMTMTQRDESPTRDKLIIPTHRRVRIVVWLLTTRTSSRPATKCAAPKGRTYGRTAYPKEKSRREPWPEGAVPHMVWISLHANGV